MKNRNLKYAAVLRWLGLALLILLVFRCAFDLKTYFFGSSIVVPGKSYDYLLRLPKGYHDFSGPRPLIVFLHGTGEVDRPAGFLRYHDPFIYASRHVSSDEFPFLVVCPVAREDRWRPNEVIEFVDELLDNGNRFQIDPDRIYLTGLSMGGFGAFETACLYPDRFAAIVPLAGGCDVKELDPLLSVPVWAFHGELDEIIPPSRSQSVVEQLQEKGPKSARFTLLPDHGHGISESVYSDPELYRWLLEQKIP